MTDPDTWVVPPPPDAPDYRRKVLIADVMSALADTAEDTVRLAVRTGRLVAHLARIRR